MAGKVYLGIDLGGTTLSAALVSDTGALQGFMAVPTPAADEPGPLATAMASLARQLLAAHRVSINELAGIGAAAPGPVHNRTKPVHMAPNLRGWEEVPLGDMLLTALGRPVALANDATVAALAEARVGAGQGAELVVYLTLGTGIGGGVVQNGQALTGASGLAGEFGHVVLRREGPVCNCGRGLRCVETLASGAAIGAAGRAQVRELQAQGVRSPLVEAAGEGPVSARTVAAAALAGDPHAQAILQEAGEELGRLLAFVVNALNPNRIVLGGGLTEMAHHLMLGHAERVMRAMAIPAAADDCTIVIGTLREKAGAIGAALYAMP